MNTTIANARLGLVALTALAAAGLMAMPSAHAGANCTVSGAHLNLRDSGDYDVIVDASGSTLGPGVVIRTSDQLWNLTLWEGGITGRTINFNVGTGGKGYVHFEGTVGADGVAHGTSSAISDPMNLAEGTWDSTDPLTC